MKRRFAFKSLCKKAKILKGPQAYDNEIVAEKADEKAANDAIQIEERRMRNIMIV